MQKTPLLFSQSGTKPRFCGVDSSPSYCYAVVEQKLTWIAHFELFTNMQMRKSELTLISDRRNHSFRVVDPTEKTNSPYVEQKGFSFARGDRRKVNTLSPFLSSLATMKVQHALSAVLRQTSASNQQGIPAWSRGSWRTTSWFLP